MPREQIRTASTADCCALWALPGRRRPRARSREASRAFAVALPHHGRSVVCSRGHTAPVDPTRPVPPTTRPHQPPPTPPSAITTLRHHQPPPSPTPAITNLRHHQPPPSPTSAITNLRHHQPPPSPTSAIPNLRHHQ